MARPSAVWVAERNDGYDGRTILATCTVKYEMKGLLRDLQGTGSLTDVYVQRFPDGCLHGKSEGQVIWDWQPADDFLNDVKPVKLPV
jgi:hypothetical protein